MKSLSLLLLIALAGAGGYTAIRILPEMLLSDPSAKREVTEQAYTPGAIPTPEPHPLFYFHTVEEFVTRWQSAVLGPLDQELHSSFENELAVFTDHLRTEWMAQDGQLKRRIEYAGWALDALRRGFTERRKAIAKLRDAGFSLHSPPETTRVDGMTRHRQASDRQFFAQGIHRDWEKQAAALKLEIERNLGVAGLR